MAYAWILTTGKAIARMKAVPSAGLCGSTLRLYGEPETIQLQGGGSFNFFAGQGYNLGAYRPASKALPAQEVEANLKYVAGAAAMVSRRFLERVGLMHDGYFIYYEEIDWSVRARRADFDIVYAPDSIVYHRHGSVIGAHGRHAPRTLLSEYFSARNRLRFTRRHKPWALPTAWVTLGLTGVNRLRRGHWRNALMVVRVMFGGEEKLENLLNRY